jgi:predicted CXXCH cytochrome family protein
MLKVTTVLFFAVIASIGFSFEGATASQEARSDALRNNTCVNCHSRLSTASDLSTRYLEWRQSAHGANSVGCDRCHGGDPNNEDVKQAHRDVLPPSNSRSRLSDSNVAGTCSVCHKAIARSFVESAHYARLKNSGMGPGCTSCHTHMASTVRRTGSQGEALCTYCHNAANGLLPQRPDIPASSKAILDAIERTQYVLKWIDDLLLTAEKRNIAVDAERKDAAAVKASADGAKVAWHTFNLDGVLDMANKAFAQAVDIRDRLNKKVGRD